MPRVPVTRPKGGLSTRWKITRLPNWHVYRCRRCEWSYKWKSSYGTLMQYGTARAAISDHARACR